MCLAQTDHFWQLGAKEIQGLRLRPPCGLNTHRIFTLLQSSIGALVQSTWKTMSIIKGQANMHFGIPILHNYQHLRRAWHTKGTLSGFVGSTYFWVTFSVQSLANAFIIVLATFSRCAPASFPPEFAYWIGSVTLCDTQGLGTYTSHHTYSLFYSASLLWNNCIDAHMALGDSRSPH